MAFSLNLLGHNFGNTLTFKLFYLKITKPNYDMIAKLTPKDSNLNFLASIHESLRSIFDTHIFSTLDIYSLLIWIPKMNSKRNLNPLLIPNQIQNNRNNLMIRTMLKSLFSVFWAEVTL